LSEALEKVDEMIADKQQVYLSGFVSRNSYIMEQIDKFPKYINLDKDYCALTLFNK
jgi:hypothetical protein